MTVHYTIDDEAYIQYNLDVMDISPNMRRMTFVMKWAVPMIYLVLPFVLSQMTSIPFMFWAVAMFITGMLWLVLFTPMFKKSIRRRIQRLLKEGPSSTFIGEHILSLEAEGFKDVTQYGETKMSYATVYRLVETNETLYIFVSPILALVLPKKYFGREDSMTIDGLKMAVTGFTFKQWERIKI